MKPYLFSMFVSAICLGAVSVTAGEIALRSYKAAPDQVLVLYNADWPHNGTGKKDSNDSREVAEYYVARHTDAATGKKPHLLGLSCRHLLQRHLSEWFIREGSNDNGAGILFTGKGAPPPDLQWVRDSRRVEIHLDDSATDWGTVRITCRSSATGEELAVTPLRLGVKISGIPATMGESAVYPPVSDGKGRVYRFDATEYFRGTVTIRVIARNGEGDVIRDFSLPYYDSRDFAFSPVGPDGIADTAVVDEDVLQPVRRFLTDPANALPDGTLLKDHILYIVVVHGIPYSAKGAFGIEHGATANRRDHGALASLDQGLQSLFYPWDHIRPPLIPFLMNGGPDADKGVVNHLITTAMRRPQTGSRWNPYMHPDTYSYLLQSAPPPEFRVLPPFGEQRTAEPLRFAYGVTRIDGTSVDDAKRLIDNAVYASRYLRPEMDCRVRGALRAQGKKEISDLSERLRESEKVWGSRELEILGFGRATDFSNEGLPFLVRPGGDGSGECGGTTDWKKGGFYPGGIDRRVISSNGLNYKGADIWNYLQQGVTVSAAGAPAYGGGPHITNATFWDNRILLKYLLRGRDLGEVLLRATFYVNWSTSLIGDPLFHPDLRHTVVDETPPRTATGPGISFSGGVLAVSATVVAELKDEPDEPEVALLDVTARDEEGNERYGVSPHYSRRPVAVVQGLAPGKRYMFSARLIDPYGNMTDLPPFSGRSNGADPGGSLFRKIFK